MKVIITEYTQAPREIKLRHTSFTIKEGTVPTQFIPDNGWTIGLVTIAADNYEPDDSPITADDIKPLP